MEFRVSAPGKVILFGEHAVVYGKSAIAASIDLRTHAVVKPSSQLTLELVNFNFTQSWSLDKIQLSCDRSADCLQKIKEQLSGFVRGSPQEQASSLAFLTLCFLTDCKGIHIRIHSDIPIGSGLGSSASFGVVVAAALMPKAPLDEINKYAFLSEKIIHENPSGVDNALCTFGGGKLYKKGEFKTIDIPALTFLLIDSGVEKDTKTQVAKVRSRYEQFPNIMIPIIDTIDQICEQFIQDTNNLKELIQFNHGLLTCCGVSHPVIEKIISICHSHDIACKITGAGGGGMLLALIDKDTNLEADLSKNGFKYFKAVLGCPGVKIE